MSLKNFMSIAVFWTFMVPFSASAFEEIQTGYFNKTALQGFDSSRYLTDGLSVKGSKTFVFDWKGATWHFADAESRDLFAASPNQYAPQYGGYCSNQMSLGNLSNIDPGVWLIHKEKLYFFGHQIGKDRWQETGIDARIKDADRHWKKYMAENK